MILRESAARLLTDLFPWLHGAEWRVEGVRHLPLDSAAAGSVVLALALYAVARVRSAGTWWGAALALFGMLARAAWRPLMDLLSMLPMLDETLNERFSFAASCAIVILAALGLEHALARDDLRVLGATLAGVLAVLAAGRIVITHAGLVTDFQSPVGCLRSVRGDRVPRRGRRHRAGPAAIASPAPAVVRRAARPALSQ